MKFFSVGKVPAYCETISHRIERRKSGDVKVVDLTLRIDPFSAQLASALDAGEFGFVKRMLYKQGDGTPVRDLRSVEFKAPGERQNLTCFATPDSPKASIVLEQVKLSQLRARGAKVGDRWVLFLRASFGPCSKSELEYINAFYTEQRFITFDEAEPSLEFEQEGEADEDDERTDADEKARRPAMDFDTTTDGRPVEIAADAAPAKTDTEPARQKLHRHAGGKETRGRRT